MASTIKLTAADCANCSWTLSEVTPEYRRYIGKGTHPVTGVPIEVQKTEFVEEAQLVAMNEHDRNETDRRRWSSGAGSEKGGNVPLIRTSRIPLNLFFNQVAPHIKDRDHLPWWLNKEENQPFRTRRGKL